MKRTRLRRIGARRAKEQEAASAAARACIQKVGGRCERCGGTKHLHAHHVTPRSRGGKHEAENLRCLCSRCHSNVHDHTACDWRDWVR